LSIRDAYKLDLPAGLLRDCAFYRDDIITLTYDGSLRRHEFQTGDVQEVNYRLGFEPMKLIDSMSEEYIWVLGLRGEIAAINPSDLSAIWSTDASPTLVGVTLSPDGRYLILAHSQGDLQLVSTTNGALLAEARTPFNSIQRIFTDPIRRSIWLKVEGGDVVEIETGDLL